MQLYAYTLEKDFMKPNPLGSKFERSMRSTCPRFYLCFSIDFKEASLASSFGDQGIQRNILGHLPASLFWQRIKESRMIVLIIFCFIVDLMSCEIKVTG